MDKATVRYSGDIVAGSLLVWESRIIARMLLEGVEKPDWRQAIDIDNVLQKRSPVTARRQARLIKSRLALMEPALWRMVVEGDADVAIQALFAAAVKQSRLLADFMRHVVASHWRVFQPHLSDADWRTYIEACAQVDPAVLKWTDATRSKLRQVVFRMLAEAKYVSDTRSLELLPVTLIPDVRQYLTDHSETFVLSCMEVCP